MVYRRQGAGPDLILLHGLLGCAAQWQPLMELWAGRFTCWALELPGISASAPIPDPDLPGLTDWLAQALAGLGLERYGLIGSSWGGAIALAAAADPKFRAPLQRLVVVAPVHPDWRASRRQRFLLHRLPARIGALIGARLSADAQRQLLATSYGDPRRVTAAAVADYRATLQRPGLGKAVGAYGRHWEQDQRALAAQLEVHSVDPDAAGGSRPTGGGGAKPRPKQAVPAALLVWGSADRVVPAASAPALQARLPQAQTVVLPGLGHLPFAEDPAAFANAVGPFLQ